MTSHFLCLGLSGSEYLKDTIVYYHLLTRHSVVNVSVDTSQCMTV